MNIIKHYFPISHMDNHKCKNDKYSYLLKNVRYTMDAIMYMSKRIDSELIVGIIISHVNKMHIDRNNLTITDATAGIGGNTFSFATFFGHVNSVEMDIPTFEMLKNNITIYNHANVTLINNDYMKIHANICQDITFIDPPWGGKNYKKVNNLRLKLSNIEIENILMIIAKSNKIVAMKLPLNYDFSQFRKIHMNDKKIYLYKLDKMYILICAKL